MGPCEETKQLKSNKKIQIKIDSQEKSSTIQPGLCQKLVDGYQKHLVKVLKEI